MNSLQNQLNEIENDTSICIQAFNNFLTTCIDDNNTLNEDALKLNRILDYICRLKLLNKFDYGSFTNYIIEKTNCLPLEIVWWLHKHEIMYFIQYSKKLVPEEFSQSILKMIKVNKKYEEFDTTEIVQDLLTELIRHHHISNYFNSDFCDRTYYYSDVLNSIIDDNLNAVFNDKNNKTFTHFLPFVRKSSLCVSSFKLNKFYKTILTKIVRYNNYNYDIYSCYIYQEMWTTTKMNKNLLLMYEEIFYKYCTLEDILDIIEKQKKCLNWKLVLITIGAYVRVSSFAKELIRAHIMKLLEESFNKKKQKLFILAILIIRQACLEENMEMSYEEWYTLTFGSKSIFKSTTDISYFTYLTETLEKLIPYEPKTYLEIHIRRTLSAPRNCNYMKCNYRSLCTSRLHLLETYPDAEVDGTLFNLFQMIEDCVRIKHNNEIILAIKEKQSNIFKTFISYLETDKEPYITFSQLCNIKK